MVDRPNLHDRTAAAILDAAASVLSEHGDTASMADVAAAAGVGRATLYRYFPNREMLWHALAAAAVETTSQRLAEAELDVVPVTEGIARVARALVAVGSKYAVLLGTHDKPDTADARQRLHAPVEDLFARGIEDGTLRADLRAEELVHLFGGLLHGALRMTTQHQVGEEHAASVVTSVFLSGAAAPVPVPAVRA